jgi:hypothetical protein
MEPLQLDQLIAAVLAAGHIEPGDTSPEARVKLFKETLKALEDSRKAEKASRGMLRRLTTRRR